VADERHAAGAAAKRLVRGLAAALERLSILEAACEVETRECEARDDEIGRRRTVVAQPQADQNRIRAAVQAAATESPDRLAAAEVATRAAALARECGTRFFFSGQIRRGSTPCKVALHRSDGPVGIVSANGEGACRRDSGSDREAEGQGVQRVGSEVDDHI
jgi:hypothetical protein